MNEINWLEIAQQYELTPEQFADQIYTTACVLWGMELESQDPKTALRFTCSDDVGELELSIKRVK